MHRTYLFLRSCTPRVLAGLTATILLAGCGLLGGGGSTPAPTTPVATVPVPATAKPGSATGDIAQGEVGGVSRTKLGGVTNQGQQGSISSGAKGVVTQGGSPGAVVSPGSSASTTQTTSTSQTTSSTPSSTSTTVSRPATTSTTKTSTTPVHTVYRTIYVTRVHRKTVYLTRTVTVAPDVPEGAFLPSKHPQLTERSFTVSDGNIGCTIGTGVVRCGILRRNWVPPLQPSDCKGSWGDTIALSGKTAAQFACAGPNPFSATSSVVPDGWDDRFGTVTCEVRIFGVDCFASSKHGFIIGRTGYALY